MPYLYDELVRYCGSDAYPFHMPGHKRRLGSMQDPFSFDITEIDGFDDLHHAEGLILEAEQRASSLYGAEETHFLVGGSTAGILAAVAACTTHGGRILMARGSHKAAYHAVADRMLMPRYLQAGRRVTAEAVRQALEEDARQHKSKDRIEAVYITSPTYEGVVSDVEGIARTAHLFHVPLIVDEAHGAHFGMHEIFPESSVKLGADLVIHSVHKTLPSLTQTALIHASGELADRRRLKEMLDIYQTSSPSYVLMASIDNCIRILKERGPELFDRLAENLKWFYDSVFDLKTISCIRTDDPSKILLSSHAVTTRKLYDILRLDYHLQPEMVTRGYVLMLCSVGDDAEGFRRLSRALHEIDAGIHIDDKRYKNISSSIDQSTDGDLYSGLPVPVMRIGEAQDREQEKVLFEEAAGRISGEYLYLYPPGIPLVTPGEQITQKLIGRVKALEEDGYSVEGAADYQLQTIYCITETG